MRAGFFVFSHCSWDQSTLSAQSPSNSAAVLPGEGCAGAPSLHGTVARSHSPPGATAPLEHHLAGCPPRGAPSPRFACRMGFGCLLLCSSACVGVARKAYLRLRGMKGRHHTHPAGTCPTELLHLCSAGSCLGAMAGEPKGSSTGRLVPTWRGQGAGWRCRCCSPVEQSMGWKAPCHEIWK